MDFPASLELAASAFAGLECGFLDSLHVGRVGLRLASVLRIAAPELGRLLVGQTITGCLRLELFEPLAIHRGALLDSVGRAM